MRDQPIPAEQFNYREAIRESVRNRDRLDWRWIDFGHDLARNLGARSYSPKWIDAPPMSQWPETQGQRTEAVCPIGHKVSTTPAAPVELPADSIAQRVLNWLTGWLR